MTALITLTDNIFAPNGEEYRAVWGEYSDEGLDFVFLSGNQFARKTVLSIFPCPRPQRDATEYLETKEGRLPHEPNALSDFSHIYYAE